MILNELRRALRTLRRRPGATLVALATLSIGIGVVTTVFSFLNGAAFRPLPYQNAARTVALGEQGRVTGHAFSSVRPETFRAIARDSRSFQSLGPYESRHVSLAGADHPAYLAATAISAGAQSILQPQPVLGRAFAPEELERGGASVAMIGERLWHTRFGARPDMIGQTVIVDDAAYEVVGVVPESFTFPDDAELFLPFIAPGDGDGEASFGLLGMLRPDVTRDQARGELRTIATRLAATDSAGHAGVSLVVQPEMVERSLRAAGPVIWLIVAAAVGLLLVACSNVASLLLVQAASRRGEMAVRASLGASRGQLIRQCLAESALLSLAAGVLGYVLAIWGVALVQALLPLQNMPRWMRFTPDIRVFGASLAMAMATLMVIGLVPALEATRVDLVSSLKSGGGTGVMRTTAPRGLRAIIGTEMALSMVLLLGGMLLARTYDHLALLDDGTDASQVVALDVTLGQTRYADAVQREAYFTDLAERARRLPSVQSVAREGYLTAFRSELASGDSIPRGNRGIWLLEHPDVSATAGLGEPPTYSSVDDDYFRTLGVPIVAGRAFARADDAGSAAVAVISQRLAAHLWPDSQPLGRSFRLGRNSPVVTVVGVARDVRDPGFGPQGVNASPTPAIYLSIRQTTSAYPRLVVRAHDEPSLLTPQLLALARATDPAHAEPRARTLAEERSVSLLAVAAIAITFAVLAGTALLLAAIGTYGVVAYSVVQRTHELGIRMALGATARDVLRTAMRDGARIGATGMIAGLVLGWLATRLLARWLYGVSPGDPLSYVLVATIFAVAILAATLIPARRATRVSPVEAMSRS